MEDIRRMWDNHVQFGLANPELYLVMFGNIRPESRPAIIADAEALMEEMLNTAAAMGQFERASRGRRPEASWLPPSGSRSC